MSWTWVRGSDDAGTGLEQPVTDADNRASSPAAINAAFTGLSRCACVYAGGPKYIPQGDA
jgi:hypothetical protein